MVPSTVASAPSPRFGRDGKTGAIGKFADDRLRHSNFRVVGLRLVLEDGNSQGMDGVRQMSGRSERVVSATGDARQSKSHQQHQETAHAVCIVASGGGSSDRRKKAPRLKSPLGSRNWTGAPGSPKRTWAENDIFRLLSVGRLSRTDWIQLDGQLKAFVGLRPSFSAQVRFGEPGAPVQFLLGSARRPAPAEWSSYADNSARITRLNILRNNSCAVRSGLDPEPAGWQKKQEPHFRRNGALACGS